MLTLHNSVVVGVFKGVGPICALKTTISSKSKITILARIVWVNFSDRKCGKVKKVEHLASFIKYMLDVREIIVGGRN